MKKELILKKCLKCGALVEILNDCHCPDCNVTCCGEKMITLLANKEEASFEKHIPTYTREGDQLKIKVNHVMENDHYIEWILVKGKNTSYKLELAPSDTPELICDYEEGMIIYSYCNKHGLWKTEVE